jgi:chromosomal replication initiation ATPase DnaA
MKTPDQILTAIAQANNVTVDQIKGRSRKREIADARKMAMAMLRKMTGMSLNAVGAYMGKDHATVNHHAKNTHPQLMDSDRNYAHAYSIAFNLLYPQAALEPAPRQLYAGKIILQPCRA